MVHYQSKHTHTERLINTHTVLRKSFRRPFSFFFFFTTTFVLNNIKLQNSILGLFSKNKTSGAWTTGTAARLLTALPHSRGVGLPDLISRRNRLVSCCAQPVTTSASLHLSLTRQKERKKRGCQKEEECIQCISKST